MRIIHPSESIPSDFSFRVGLNTDAPKIINLIYSILREYRLVPEPDGVDQDLAAVEHSYKNGFFGVIEYNGDIVATYGLYPIDSNVVEIRKMYAHPSVRGKGIGTWMVKHLIELAKHNGYSQLELETASQLIEAIGLYRKIGFIEKEFENKTLRCDKSFYLNI